MLVVGSERQQLLKAGRLDLADRIVHVAAIEGDGAGYVIRSFTTDGEDKFIEAKTTRGNETQRMRA